MERLKKNFFSDVQLSSTQSQKHKGSDERAVKCEKKKTQCLYKD